ncbi:hypothetical protein FISHEDRAFT_69290 [Fistulina hepatica ATCC 64428]|uniref:F-box domain-containing protein n=1 Tax=Fistulina hepatica ATCC 64428 TaxID=1128425 RepID=A0A0D7AMR1_9AGAR|nr:hypothetical protein FISHEDRAFT_69290 [Fistulina hepatica ATCC 64428]
MSPTNNGRGSTMTDESMDADGSASIQDRAQCSTANESVVSRPESWCSRAEARFLLDQDSPSKRRRVAAQRAESELDARRSVPDGASLFYVPLGSRPECRSNGPPLDTTTPLSFFLEASFISALRPTWMDSESVHRVGTTMEVDNRMTCHHCTQVFEANCPLHVFLYTPTIRQTPLSDIVMNGASTAPSPSPTDLDWFIHCLQQRAHFISAFHARLSEDAAGAHTLSRLTFPAPCEEVSVLVDAPHPLPGAVAVPLPPLFGGDLRCVRRLAVAHFQPWVHNTFADLTHLALLHQSSGLPVCTFLQMIRASPRLEELILVDTIVDGYSASVDHVRLISLRRLILGNITAKHIASILALVALPPSTSMYLAPSRTPFSGAGAAQCLPADTSRLENIGAVTSLRLTSQGLTDVMISATGGSSTIYIAIGRDEDAILALSEMPFSWHEVREFCIAFPVGSTALGALLRNMSQLEVLRVPGSVLDAIAPVLRAADYPARFRACRRLRELAIWGLEEGSHKDALQLLAVRHQLGARLDVLAIGPVERPGMPLTLATHHIRALVDTVRSRRLVQDVMELENDEPFRQDFRNVLSDSSQSTEDTVIPASTDEYLAVERYDHAMDMEL